MAQAVHAAGETGRAIPGTYAVVLQAKTEQQLLHIAAKLERFGIDHHVVREPDPPYLGQAMAIGLPPGPRCKALSNLPLYKGPK